MRKTIGLTLIVLVYISVPIYGFSNDLSIYNINVNETEKIKLLKWVLTRENGVLTIRLKNGVRIDFVDVRSDGERARIHKFLGIDEVTNNYVIEIEHLEWKTYVQLDPYDGRTQALPGLPIYSPSNLRFFCFEPSGMDGAWIKVYQINEKSHSEIFSFGFQDWDADNPEWIDDDTISYNAFKYKHRVKPGEKNPRIQSNIKCGKNRCEVRTPDL